MPGKYIHWRSRSIVMHNCQYNRYNNLWSSYVRWLYRGGHQEIYTRTYIYIYVYMFLDVLPCTTPTSCYIWIHARFSSVHANYCALHFEDEVHEICRLWIHYPCARNFIKIPRKRMELPHLWREPLINSTSDNSRFRRTFRKIVPMAANLPEVPVSRDISFYANKVFHTAFVKVTNELCGNLDTYIAYVKDVINDI